MNAKKITTGFGCGKGRSYTLLQRTGIRRDLVAKPYHRNKSPKQVELTNRNTEASRLTTLLRVKDALQK